MRQINITENANKDRAWEGSNKLTKMALKNKKENKKYTIQQANELVEKLESNNEQENEEAIIEFKSFLIRNYISYKMFDILPNIQLKKQGYEEEEEALIEDDKNMIK